MNERDQSSGLTLAQFWKLKIYDFKNESDSFYINTVELLIRNRSLIDRDKMFAFFSGCPTYVYFYYCCQSNPYKRGLNPFCHICEPKDYGDFQIHYSNYSILDTHVYFQPERFWFRLEEMQDLVEKKANSKNNLKLNTDFGAIKELYEMTFFWKHLFKKLWPNQNEKAIKDLERLLKFRNTDVFITKCKRCA
jgi:hypothetical protein